MAKEPEENDVVDEEEEVPDVEAAKRDALSGKADLEKVTDYAEEKEIDASSLSQAMSKISSTSDEDEKKLAARAKTLAAVKINKDDVTLIATEMEISRETAEEKLREHQGDAVATLRALTD